MSIFVNGDESKTMPKQHVSRVMTGVAGICLGLAVGLGVGFGYHGLSSSSSSSSSASSLSPIPTPSSSSPSTSPTPWTQAPVAPGVFPPQSGRPVFMFLGDSITQMAADPAADGFTTRLQWDYVRTGDVLNRGLTVYNTKGFVSTALPVLEKELTTWLSPAFVAVWFGVNDAVIVGGRYESQHVDVAKYKRNLITIMTSLRKNAPNAKLLLMTPATVDNDQRLADQLRAGLAATPLDRTNEETAKYAAACREVIDSVEGVTLLDTYKYFMETYPNSTERGKLQMDGLHFNSDGHAVVEKLLMGEIEKLMPGFSGGPASLQVPEWNSLNDKYPANKNDK